MKRKEEGDEKEGGRRKEEGGRRKRNERMSSRSKEEKKTTKEGPQTMKERKLPTKQGARKRVRDSVVKGREKASIAMRSAIRALRKAYLEVQFVFI